MFKLKNTTKQFYNLLPDRLFIQLKFYKRLGYFPNLKNPTTINEKINWLKLNYRNSLLVICSDKFLVREFLSKIIGAKYLIPLVYQTYNVNDVNKENLPDFPIVIKTNHDSGGVWIVKNKNDIDFKIFRKILTKQLSINYYYNCREWQYKYIKPCIMVEKFLADKNGERPKDYKIYCFNGFAKLVSVDSGRGHLDHTREYYDLNWVKQKFYWAKAKNNGNTEKPIVLNEMIALSERIAKNFIFVRIDWYIIGCNLFIGELTFQPFGGFERLEPDIWDKNLGRFLDLNNI